MGLHRAGFDVTGVDLHPQPNYPFEFIQGDALKTDLDGYDFVCASPPCQAHSAATRNKSSHRSLIHAVREKLRAWGGPYVIENVVGAPLLKPITLCGAMFGLAVVRHRLFEANWALPQPPHRKHPGSIVTGEFVTVAGNGGVPAWTLKERERRGLPRHVPGEMSLGRWQAAMGIDWLPRTTLVQAIPPAYSEWIGRQFLAQREAA